MAMSEELSGFVKEALVRGLTPAQIEDALLRAGWTHEQVRAALAGFAQFDFPIPVPRPKPYLSAREAFLTDGFQRPWTSSLGKPGSGSLRTTPEQWTRTSIGRSTTGSSSSVRSSSVSRRRHPRSPRVSGRTERAGDVSS